MADPKIIEARTEADVEAVRRLCWDYRAFLFHASDIDRLITETFYPAPKYEALMGELPKIHARPKGQILLARGQDGAPLGCGMSQALDDELSEIKRVFVTPEGRGQGVARRLCQALVDQARADGFNRVVLDTSIALTGAQALYRAMDFKERGPYQPIPEHMLPYLKFYELPL